MSKEVVKLEADCSRKDVIVACDKADVGETIQVHGFEFKKYIDSELGVMMENKIGSVYPTDILDYIAGKFGDTPE